MKQTISILLLLFAIQLMAQDSTLIKELPNLKSRLSKQKDEIKSLKSELQALHKVLQSQKFALKQLNDKTENHNQQVDSLAFLINLNGEKIKSLTNRLAIKIKRQADNTQSQIKQLDDSISDSISAERKLWIVVYIVSTILIVATLWLLFKGIKSNKRGVMVQKQKTLDIYEENIKLDRKLVELLEKMPSPKEVNHSQALKLADEITRMTKNINRIPSSSKGIKPLMKGIERIKSNLIAEGYEITELMHKKFDDRMTIEVVNVVENEDLEEGEKIISKIIKPQVLYNGVLIQRAQVEVSQN